MLISRIYHGGHIDKIEIYPETSCELDYPTAAEIDYMDKRLLKDSPKIYRYLTELQITY